MLGVRVRADVSPLLPVPIPGNRSKRIIECADTCIRMYIVEPPFTLRYRLPLLSPPPSSERLVGRRNTLRELVSRDIDCSIKDPFFKLLIISLVPSIAQAMLHATNSLMWTLVPEACTIIAKATLSNLFHSHHSPPHIPPHH